jgi:hypothetical protein
MADATITNSEATTMNVPDAPAMWVKMAVPMPSSSAMPPARLRAVSPTPPSLKR